MEYKPSVTMLNLLSSIDVHSIHVLHTLGHTVDKDAVNGEFGLPDSYSSKPQHMHTCFELNYILEGDFEITADSVDRSLSPYDLVIYSPHCIHGSTKISNKRDAINVWFDAVYSPEYTPCFSVVPDYSGVMRWLFEQLRKEFTERQNNYQEIMRSLLYSIILYSCRLLRNTQPSASMNRLLPVRNYLELNYNLPLNVSQLADMVSISKSHFFKVFRDEAGMSPLEYLNQLRLTHAKEFLQTTDLSISEISYIIGFEDFRYFSRLFKQETGLSPREWKKAHAADKHPPLSVHGDDPDD